jgi:hypothetical protein
VRVLACAALRCVADGAARSRLGSFPPPQLPPSAHGGPSPGPRHTGPLEPQIDSPSLSGEFDGLWSEIRRAELLTPGSTPRPITPRGSRVATAAAALGAATGLSAFADPSSSFASSPFTFTLPRTASPINVSTSGAGSSGLSAAAAAASAPAFSAGFGGGSALHGGFAVSGDGGYSGHHHHHHHHEQHHGAAPYYRDASSDAAPPMSSSPLSADRSHGGGGGGGGGDMSSHHMDHSHMRAQHQHEQHQPSVRIGIRQPVASARGVPAMPPAAAYSSYGHGYGHVGGDPAFGTVDHDADDGMGYGPSPLGYGSAMPPAMGAYPTHGGYMVPTGPPLPPLPPQSSSSGVHRAAGREHAPPLPPTPPPPFTPQQQQQQSPSPYMQQRGLHGVTAPLPPTPPPPLPQHPPPPPGPPSRLVSPPHHRPYVAPPLPSSGPGHAPQPPLPMSMPMPPPPPPPPLPSSGSQGPPHKATRKTKVCRHFLWRNNNHFGSTCEYIHPCRLALLDGVCKHGKRCTDDHVCKQDLFDGGCDGGPACTGIHLTHPPDRDALKAMFIGWMRPQDGDSTATAMSSAFGVTGSGGGVGGGGGFPAGSRHAPGNGHGGGGGSVGGGGGFGGGAAGDNGGDGDDGGGVGLGGNDWVDADAHDTAVAVATSVVDAPSRAHSRRSSAGDVPTDAVPRPLCPFWFEDTQAGCKAGPECPFDHRGQIQLPSRPLPTDGNIRFAERQWEKRNHNFGKSAREIESIKKKLGVQHAPSLHGGGGGGGGAHGHAHAHAHGHVPLPPSMFAPPPTPPLPTSASSSSVSTSASAVYGSPQSVARALPSHGHVMAVPWKMSPVVDRRAL